MKLKLLTKSLPNETILYKSDKHSVEYKNQCLIGIPYCLHSAYFNYCSRLWLTLISRSIVLFGKLSL